MLLVARSAVTASGETVIVAEESEAGVKGGHNTLQRGPDSWDSMG